MIKIIVEGTFLGKGMIELEKEKLIEFVELVELLDMKLE